jgi:sulfide:quinone oxidoreductase
METKTLTPFLAVSGQIDAGDIGSLASRGFRTIINNRPDGEGNGQPSSDELEKAAGRLGMAYRHIPIVPGHLTDENVAEFAAAMDEVKGPALAFCRTGNRSASLWALNEARHLDPDAILKTTAAAGYDLNGLRSRLDAIAGSATSPPSAQRGRGNTADVVIVGGGAGGISTAASLLKRRPDLSVTLVEPRDVHYYQPGWTLVGGGVFDRRSTQRSMASVMPKAVNWLQTAVASFHPQRNEVVLEDGSIVTYRVLVVAPGLKLDWAAIPGLPETLGKNGVTSNYLFDMAPYTWELTQSLRDGQALFTQPPMPIKCAGAPQKAMYMSCDHWRRSRTLSNIDVEFHSAGAVLFGVKEYVPALMEYVKRYQIELNLESCLAAVDGPGRTATFTTPSGEVTREFDMVHVVPPQSAPDFVRHSPIAGDRGWVDVHQETLQHSRFGNIFAVGDVSSAPNAKTAAAVRKQAPVVAVNVLAVLDGRSPRAVYDGYGSCPLTVERGKIVLAEFGYGGRLQPSFPKWLIDGTKPSRLAWLLKEKVLPPIYFELMLKGREWLAEPQLLPHAPAPHSSAADFAGRVVR